ncbi:MAG: hypothetical protein V4537_15750 [Pseudomonadota bacterium]
MKLSLTPLFAAMVGLAVAIAFLLVPAAVLETAVLDSGIPALLPAAAPPLGWTARVALGMTVGGAAAAAAWLGAFLLLGGEGVVSFAIPTFRMPSFALPKFALPKLTVPKLTVPKFTRVRSPREILSVPSDHVPVLRRADAHPDAPARAPLLATRDLGVPFLDVRAPKPAPVERDLPADLDATLSAFDPFAIPAAPAEPVRAVAPLQSSRSAIQDVGERFETFELHPPIAAARTDATIHALLDRLERGVSARQPDGAVAGNRDETLGELRRLATR